MNLDKLRSEEGLLLIKVLRGIEPLRQINRWIDRLEEWVYIITELINRL